MKNPNMPDVQTLRRRAVAHAATHFIDGPRSLKPKTLRFVSSLSAHVVMIDTHQPRDTPDGLRRQCIVSTATAHTLRRHLPGTESSA